MAGAVINLDTAACARRDSSGGILARSMAVLANQRGGPAIRFQALLYPVTDCDLTRESYAQFGSGVLSGHESPGVVLAAIHSNPRANRSTRLPIAHPLSEWAGSAPALVNHCGMRRSARRGEAYARQLAEAGVPTAMWRALGTVHAFLLDNALAGSTQQRVLSGLLVAHLRAALCNEDCGASSPVIAVLELV